MDKDKPKQKYGELDRACTNWLDRNGIKVEKKKEMKQTKLEFD